MGDSPGKPRLVIQLAESLENQPHPDWLNMTQAMAECVRLCPLGNPNNYDWIRTNKKSQALCIQFDFNMLDDEPVPATSFADPECLWAELGRAPSYPILYGLDRNRVPPTEFEENLPFGTVVAIQAMLTTWDFPARKGPCQSAFAQKGKASRTRIPPGAHHVHHDNQDPGKSPG